MTEEKYACDPLAPNPGLYGLPFTTDDFQGMPYRRLGGSGLRVSSVGLGTWKFGYPETGDGARVNEAAAMKILDKAVELGVTFWDTANRYNNSSGNSERIIGKWFAANPEKRRDIELATKIYGTMDGRTPNYCRLSRTNILEAAYACLDRLQTDRIDVMQFHNFDPTTPIEESLAAVEDLMSQDLVRYLGVSNFNVENLEAYGAYSAVFRRARVVSVQNQFDILYGETPEERGVLEYCADSGPSYIAWSPLRGGLISDRYLDKAGIKAGDRLVDENRLDKELTEPIHKKLAALAGLARKWDMSLSLLALAYMLHLPGMGPLIAASSTPEQLVENAKAGKIILSQDQIKAVEGILAGTE